METLKIEFKKTILTTHADSTKMITGLVATAVTTEITIVMMMMIELRFGLSQKIYWSTREKDTMRSL